VGYEVKTRPPTVPDPRLKDWTDYPCVIVTNDDDETLFTVVKQSDFDADRDGVKAQIVDLAQAKREKLAELASIRWERTQTFVYDGVRTPSGDTAVAYLTGAVVAIQSRVPPPTVEWKLADGEFRTYDLAALVAFGGAMRDHIQVCFDNEKALAAQIAAAATSREVMAIDLTIGWPG
jgi:hypothetical protein